MSAKSQIWIFLLVLLPLELQAGNTRSFFLGDEAAMTAGAGIAVTRDSGSLWYNPAGLGGLQLGRMELTGSAYNAKLRSVDAYLTTQLPSGEKTASIRADDYGAIATSLVFVRNANDKVSYGFAWYQPVDEWVDFRADIRGKYGSQVVPDFDWSQGLEYHQRAYAYYVGPALGIELNPRLRIGFTLFGIYESYSGSYQSFAARTSPTGAISDEYFTISKQLKYKQMGLTLVSGLQWQLNRHLHTALIIRSPVVTIITQRDAAAVQSGALANQQPTFLYNTDVGTEWGFEQTQPMETQIGLAYKTEEWWIGAEGAIRPPLDNKDLNLLWNASIGGRVRVSEKLNVGAGLFTDRTADKKPDGTSLMQNQLHRYGLSFGVEMRTPIKVSGNERSQLEFSTTAAASYSFEIGQMSSVYLDPESGKGFEFPTTDVLFHQGFLHVGTALYF